MKAKKPTKINITRIKLIQSGDNTHIHFQSMTWVSFKTINATVNRPPKPMPELLDDDEFDIVTEI